MKTSMAFVIIMLASLTLETLTNTIVGNPQVPVTATKLKGKGREKPRLINPNPKTSTKQLRQQGLENEKKMEAECLEELRKSRVGQLLPMKLIKNVAAQVFVEGSNDADRQDIDGFDGSTLLIQKLSKVGNTFLTAVQVFKQMVNPPPILTYGSDNKTKISFKRDYMDSGSEARLTYDIGTDTALGEGSFGAVKRGVDEQKNQRAIKIASSLTEDALDQIQNEHKVYSALKKRFPQGLEGFPSSYGCGPEIPISATEEKRDNSGKHNDIADKQQGEENGKENTKSAQIPVKSNTPTSAKLVTKEVKWALAMDILGYSHQYYLDMCNRRFSLKTTMLLADQMLKRIETFHNSGFVHNDIKPDNFLMGPVPSNTEKRRDNFLIWPVPPPTKKELEKYNTVHLVDFGAATDLQEWKKSMPEFSNAVAGTPAFMSFYTHRHAANRPRNDLQSFFFTIMLYLRGSLPWEYESIKDVQEHYAKKVKNSPKREKSVDDIENPTDEDKKQQDDRTVVFTETTVVTKSENDNESDASNTNSPNTNGGVEASPNIGSANLKSEKDATPTDDAQNNGPQKADKSQLHEQHGAGLFVCRNVHDSKERHIHVLADDFVVELNIMKDYIFGGLENIGVIVDFEYLYFLIDKLLQRFGFSRNEPVFDWTQKLYKLMLDPNTTTIDYAFGRARDEPSAVRPTAAVITSAFYSFAYDKFYKPRLQKKLNLVELSDTLMSEAAKLASGTQKPYRKTLFSGMQTVIGVMLSESQIASPGYKDLGVKTHEVMNPDLYKIGFGCFQYGSSQYYVVTILEVDPVMTLMTDKLNLKVRRAYEMMEVAQQCADTRGKTESFDPTLLNCTIVTISLKLKNWPSSDVLFTELKKAPNEKQKLLDPEVSAVAYGINMTGESVTVVLVLLKFYRTGLDYAGYWRKNIMPLQYHPNHTKVAALPGEEVSEADGNTLEEACMRAIMGLGKAALANSKYLSVGIYGKEIEKLDEDTRIYEAMKKIQENMPVNLQNTNRHSNMTLAKPEYIPTGEKWYHVKAVLEMPYRAAFELVISKVPMISIYSKLADLKNITKPECLGLPPNETLKKFAGLDLVVSKDEIGLPIYGILGEFEQPRNNSLDNIVLEFAKKLLKEHPEWIPNDSSIKISFVPGTEEIKININGKKFERVLLLLFEEKVEQPVKQEKVAEKEDAKKKDDDKNPSIISKVISVLKRPWRSSS